MAIKYSGIRTEQREVDLNNIPQIMKDISAKSTVPLLVMPNGDYLDESWDIVKWAVGQHDPANWLGKDGEHLLEAEMLIEMNDYSFKDDLDRYQYADQYPDHAADYYREQAEVFLQDLELRLASSPYLIANSLSIADIGIFPFIREFALVDRPWFDHAPYPRLRLWLDTFLASDNDESTLYRSIMHKQPLWHPASESVFLDEY